MPDMLRRRAEMALKPEVAVPFRPAQGSTPSMHAGTTPPNPGGSSTMDDNQRSEIAPTAGSHDAGCCSARPAPRRRPPSSPRAAMTTTLVDSDDGGRRPTTTGGAATTAGGSATTSGGSATTTGAGSTDLATLLGIDAASAGKGKTIELGAVLALTGNGSFYGKTMSRGIDLAAKHIEAARRPDVQVSYMDHKSGDPRPACRRSPSSAPRRPGQVRLLRRRHRGDARRHRSSTRCSRFDGGGGTGIIAQGKPFFWGTRAITPERPDAGPVQVDQGGVPRRQDRRRRRLGPRRADNNEGTKADSSRRSTAGGYEFNGLYELVPIGDQDFSRCCRRSRPTSPTSCCS